MDNISKEKRSWTMAQVHSSGNKSTEQKIIILFKTNKITGWRRKYPLIGKPDFVFPKKKLALFIDGCFWHGHPKLCRIPKTNQEYWIKKIEKNKKRDKKITEELVIKGWKVIRIWENEIGEENIIKQIKEITQTGQ